MDDTTGKGDGGQVGGQPADPLSKIKTGADAVAYLRARNARDAAHRADKILRQHDDDDAEQARAISEQRATLRNRAERRLFDAVLKECPRPERRNKATPAEKVQRRIAREEKRQNKLLAQLNADGPVVVRPEMIPLDEWDRARKIIGDVKGNAAAYYLGKCTNRIAVALLRVAISPHVLNGANDGALRARRIVALGLFLLGHAKYTRRGGDRWRYLVRGIPQTAIVRLLADPQTGKRPRLDSLIKEDGKGWVGYLAALVEVRFMYCQQIKWLEGEDPRKIRGWQNIAPNEMASRPKRGKDGRSWRCSLNRMRIITDQYEHAFDPDEMRRLIRLHDAGDDLAADPTPWFAPPPPANDARPPLHLVPDPPGDPP